MEIREWISKIGENKKIEDMQKLGDMLAEIIYMTKDSHPEIYEKYKMCIYEIAFGKVLTKEMAEKWVQEMKPMAKWDYDTTTAVKKQYWITDINDISFYVVINMLYSDLSNVLGNGDTPESLEKYITATKDWLKDPDVASDKLYNYWRYVVK